jgi:hypothetical protein
MALGRRTELRENLDHDVERRIRIIPVVNVGLLDGDAAAASPGRDLLWPGGGIDRVRRGRSASPLRAAVGNRKRSARRGSNAWDARK